MVIAGEGHRGPQEVLILVHALDKGRQEQQKLGILAGGGAGLEEVLAAVGGQRPVVVLAGAVDAGKGLFVEQAHQAVAVRHFFHHLHGQLVLVAGGVGVGIDGGHLVLGGGHLIVLGLGEHPQSPERLVQVLHVSRHPGLDGAEVVILQLLALGRLGAEEGPAAKTQVLPLVVELLVDEEVLLLGTHLGHHPLGLRVAEEAQDPHRLAGDLVHGPQQRCLFIQRCAGVRAEDGGDAEGSLLDKGKGGGVPGSVAPGLKGGPQAAGGEGGCVRLAPDQFLTGKLHDDLAAAYRRDKAVVLFRGDAGHGLEPVGIVGGALLHSPLLHGLGDLIGGADIQRGAVADALLPGAVRGGREPLLHGLLVKDHTAEQFREFHIGAHKVILLLVGLARNQADCSAHFPASPYRLSYQKIGKTQ